ncbi:MAG: hypothetical protein KDB80_10835, partial [Planctomycetes bacterium]|nr:hypothetical protein [Planctomycetota bacterium]
MTNLRNPSILLAAVCSAPILAQNPLPTLSSTPSVPIASPLGIARFDVSGFPGRSFALLGDVTSGPLTAFDTELRLGLTPTLMTLASGSLSGVGDANRSFSVVGMAGLDGLVLYSQAFELDPGAPNGMFRVSNGSSTCFHDT